MPEPRLDIQNLKVRDLIEDYRGGRLVVPEFQREYVWKPSRAPRLCDSVFRRFPISVLLLWTSDAETRSRRRDPRPSRAGLVSWLIDGQQRVITLSRILSGDEGIDVVFNPNESSFRLANAATRRDSNWVRVSELLDNESYRQIRRTLPEGIIPDCGDTDSSAAPSALSMAPISHWTTVGFCNGCPGGAARSMSQGLRVLVLEARTLKQNSI
jgi:hypothetical protein